MGKNDDAIYAFLTDLKHQRQAVKRLFHLAEEKPEMVLAFLDSLPEGWEKIGSRETDLYLTLQQVAYEALQRKTPK